MKVFAPIVVGLAAAVADEKKVEFKKIFNINYIFLFGKTMQQNYLAIKI